MQQQVILNYYDIPIGSIEKTVKTHGYLKYGYTPALSTGFSDPNVLIDNKAYVAQNLYIFGATSAKEVPAYYNVDQPHDGLLIIENRPLDASLQHKRLITVFLLKTSFLTPSNSMDSLITTGATSFDLNAFLSAFGRAPCLLFDNVALCLTPIYVHSSFAKFVSPQHVSVGLLNPYSATSTPTYKGIMTVQGNSLMQPLGKVIEGMTDAPLPLPTQQAGGEADTETCSPYIDSSNVAEIAMVPVDKDFLNGVYQITMIRQISNYFITMMIIMGSVLVYPKLYEVMVMQFVINKLFSGHSDKYLENRAIAYIGSIIVFHLLLVGMLLTAIGVGSNAVAFLYIGIGFTLSLIFGALAINYYTMTVWDKAPAYSATINARPPPVTAEPSFFDSFNALLTALFTRTQFLNVLGIVGFVEIFIFAISVGTSSMFATNGFAFASMLFSLWSVVSYAVTVLTQ
jgi:hypothetical protein